MCVKTVKKKKKRKKEKKGQRDCFVLIQFLKITTWYKIRVTFGDSRVILRGRGDVY